MLLEAYLKENNTSISDVKNKTNISEQKLRRLNKRQLQLWNYRDFEMLSIILRKDIDIIIAELSALNKKIDKNYYKELNGRYNIENRRYIGSKAKLLNKITQILEEETEGQIFFDVFAGTGIVTRGLLDKYKSFIINDFLYSNHIIYEAFFSSQKINIDKILRLEEEYQNIKSNKEDDDYFVSNYGGKYFSYDDARIIGEIRTRIQNNKKLNNHERAILIASLLYSSDKIANTVGHYDAFRRIDNIPNRFVFELINPLDVTGKNIKIYQEDANKLVKSVSSDIAFIDPPYNSRQYSRFYHVLENLTKWDKPTLTGVAMKPPVEHMSKFSKASAPETFDDLIQNIKAKYIVVTYNNTYTSKSSSSRNKITHTQIIDSLNKVGTTKTFEIPYKYFNSGKTNLKNHKEFLFVTEVRNNE